MLKGQDMVVLAALMTDGAHEASYAQLAKRAWLSVSETHGAVRRLQDAALVDGGNHVRARNTTEFLMHGLRYIFPLKMTQERSYGVPAFYAAPLAAGDFAYTGDAPVWKSPSGGVFGRVVEPLYPSAPEAAANDRQIYDRLAAMDMLRGGRIRERLFAERKVEEFLQHEPH